MSRIVIIILTMNQREMTLNCLKTLYQTNNTAYRILVWDNGSRDGTGEAIRHAYPDVIVHEHAVNLGVASGRNAAAQLAIEKLQPSHLLFLDNDIFVEEGFVAALYAPFSQDESVGQAQGKLRLMDDRERLNDAGGARINYMFWQISLVGYGEIDQGQYDIIKKCISEGGVMMVRSDLFQRLGGFDKQFDPFGPEDLDFSLRLQKAGYVALFVPQAVGYHAVSHTFGSGYTEEYARHKSRHWIVFMRRHASPLQQLGFLVLGIPYLAFSVVAREARKGNLGAIRGLLWGALDFAKSAMQMRVGQR